MKRTKTQKAVSPAPEPQTYRKVRFAKGAISKETFWCHDPFIAARHSLELPFIATDVVQLGGGLVSISLASMHPDFEHEIRTVSELTIASMLLPATAPVLESKASNNGGKAQEIARQQRI